MRKWSLCTLLLLTACSQTPAEEPEQKEKTDNYQLIVSIQDLTPPKIYLKKDSIEVIKGEEIDLDEWIDVSDNLDHNLRYTAEGSYDTDEAGIYTLTIIAEDTDGNRTEDTLTIEVTDPEPEEPEPEIPNIPDQIPEREPVSEKDPIPEVPQLPPVSNYVPESIYFYFADGYTYQSAYDACVAAGSNALNNNQAARYRCDPIKEENRYIGYKLTFE